MTCVQDIEIVAHGRGAYVLRADGQEQSYVDLADPTRLVFDYVRRLGDVLDVCLRSGPATVVHVGGAAMTLPRYVVATRPGSRQVVLEPSAGIVAAVRADLPLPRGAGVKVRVIDGRSGVAALADGRTDAVVVDAFADGRVPADLVTTEFFADLARVLTPHGVLAMNVTDHPPFRWTRRVVAGVRTHFPHVALLADPTALKARRGGNLVLVASRTDLPVSALTASAVRTGTPQRTLDARAVSDTFGGGAAWTDAQSQPSPAP